MASEQTRLESIIQKLAELEREARKLDPGREERTKLWRSVKDFVECYLQDLPELPTYVSPDALKKESFSILARFPETGRSMDELLDLFERLVNRPGLKPGAPGYLAFIPGAGLFTAALGDLLAAITNKYAGIYFAGPGAVRVEKSLVRWMAGLVGYPQEADGDLTSGGSIAHLSAIVAAREAAGLDASTLSRAVIYMSEQTHHSVHKALKIAGLHSCPLRFIPLDSSYRMRPDALEEQIRSDRRMGLRPFFLVASAGTTDSGAVDPLAELASVAETYGLWFHVDAAYGGAFALCEEGKKRLKGIERSHSLILDPHKGFFLPFGTGAVLVREGKLLEQAFAYRAPYLEDGSYLADQYVASPADLSPELSRHFRGLRFWLALQYHGVALFRAALEEKLWLARYAYEKLKDHPGFELGPPPDLSIFTFRYLPKHRDPESANRKLIETVQKSGAVFLSSTRINGRTTLRIAVLGFRTHREHIDRAIDLIADTARKLDG
jgi:glutamate/tyrosine decarboxylase-like PLP-dependent enzyme